MTLIQSRRLAELICNTAYLYFGATMADTHLRLVSDQDVFESVARKQPTKVSVSMQQVLPLLVDAVRSNRRWIDDFSDETVEISSDLYEVLLAYKAMRRAA